MKNQRHWLEPSTDLIHANTSSELWELLKPLARQMRHSSTPAEDLLWKHLRNRQIQNMKFRRQHTIERFIVDFFCVDMKLVVEVDGEIHAYTKQDDAVRQEFLENLGLKVIRFSNDRVLNHTNNVIETIRQTIIDCHR
ncbi:MAG: endonuclease domain-containing protein [Chloroflexota bacterium]